MVEGAGPNTQLPVGKDASSVKGRISVKSDTPKQKFAAAGGSGSQQYNAGGRHSIHVGRTTLLPVPYWLYLV